MSIFQAILNARSSQEFKTIDKRTPWILITTTRGKKWKLRYQQANAELSISYLSQRRGSLNQSAGLGYDLFHSKHSDVRWLFTFTYAVTNLSKTFNKLSPRCQHADSINIKVFSTQYFRLPANRWFSKLRRVGYRKKYRVAVGHWTAFPKVRQYLTARVKQLKSPKQGHWVNNEWQG